MYSSIAATWPDSLFSHHLDIDGVHLLISSIGLYSPSVPPFKIQVSVVFYSVYSLNLLQLLPLIQTSVYFKIHLCEFDKQNIIFKMV